MPHMKTKIGEYAIIVNENNEFLMLRFPDAKHGWHFPGGRLDEGEKSVEGLRREVLEETNLQIENIQPVFTTIFTEEQKYGVFFRADFTGADDVKISEEHRAYQWFAEEDIPEINFWQDFYKELLQRYVFG